MIHPDVTLILPTRGRPDLARRALNSIAETAADPARLEVVLYVDDDDPVSHTIDHPDLQLVRLIRPRTRMGAITRACYAASTGRYMMLMNDDVVCRTPGWDTAVRSACARYPDDIVLVWGNDLFRGPEQPCHPILPRIVCAVMGGICPADYRRDYIDTHIYDVFRHLRRLGHDRLVYLPDVVFEHLHVEAGKAAVDATCHKERQADDEWTYIEWAEERARAAALLARHIVETPASLIHLRCAV
jgi:hypothetical protein